MAYRLYFTDHQITEMEYRATKATPNGRAKPHVFETLDDALGMAKQLIARGFVPWEIEIDNTITHDEISRLIGERGAYLDGLPKRVVFESGTL